MSNNIDKANWESLQDYMKDLKKLKTLEDANPVFFKLLDNKQVMEEQDDPEYFGQINEYSYKDGI